MKFVTNLTSFKAGILSKKLHGRTDIREHPEGLSIGGNSPLPKKMGNNSSKVDRYRESFTSVARRPNRKAWRSLTPSRSMAWNASALSARLTRAPAARKATMNSKIRFSIPSRSPITAKNYQSPWDSPGSKYVSRRPNSSTGTSAPFRFHPDKMSPWKVVPASV